MRNSIDFVEFRYTVSAFLSTLLLMSQICFVFETSSELLLLVFANG